MNIQIQHIVIVITIISLSTATMTAQETVFSGLKSSLKRADKYFDNQSYNNALELYLEVEKKGKGGDEINLKIARVYHTLNQPHQAVIWYENFLISNPKLTRKDSDNYAVSLISQGQYEKAVRWLKKQQPGIDMSDHEIVEKIWRLQNVQHLYTDSSYYQVRPVDFNTSYADYGPAYVDRGLVFTSNRREGGGIKKIDPVTDQPYQKLYFIEFNRDTLLEQTFFGKPREFLREQSTKLHQGTLAANGSMLIFARTDLIKETNQSRLQLYWAQKTDGTWESEKPFEYNSNNYSVSHPAFNSDGKTLYFVSDMPGGYGGTDLYQCQWGINGWSKPKNLGSSINSNKNETAPFMHENSNLYFASDGHGGLGGLDIFKVNLSQPDQVHNLGYPINTSSDDFGLIVNRSGSNGFFASNRATGGFNDDIYEVVIDLQEYPLIISGTVRYNDPDWKKPDRTDLLPNAQLNLLDHLTGYTVFETISDERGVFSLNIPYSSQYRIQIVDDRVGQPSVSLEIPRSKKKYTAHEIVVVKEKFKKSVK